MLIEALEERRLMSGGVSADVNCFGTLVVWGTAEADVIDIFEVDGMVTVVANQDAENPVFFGAATGIIVDARGGNDVLSYTGNSLNSMIFLSQGDDFLQVSAVDRADVLVFGGSGYDTILAEGNVWGWA